MASSTRSNLEGSSTHPDLVAAQLAIIASRIESIASQLKIDVAEIKEAWMDDMELEDEPSSNNSSDTDDRSKHVLDDVQLAPRAYSEFQIQKVWHSQLIVSVYTTIPGTWLLPCKLLTNRLVVKLCRSNWQQQAPPEFKTDLRFQSSAVAAIQEALEADLVGSFEAFKHKEIVHQPPIERLIAWHNNSLPFDLRTSQFSGLEVLIRTHCSLLGQTGLGQLLIGGNPGGGKVNGGKTFKNMGGGG